MTNVMAIILLYLHRDDSVDGNSAPFAEVPCFLPVVPRITSCSPDLFQQIEYLGERKSNNYFSFTYRYLLCNRLGINGMKMHKLPAC